MIRINYFRVIVSLPLETEDLDLAKYFPNLSDL